MSIYQLAPYISLGKSRTEVVLIKDIHNIKAILWRYYLNRWLSILIFNGTNIKSPTTVTPSKQALKQSPRHVSQVHMCFSTC